MAINMKTDASKNFVVTLFHKVQGRLGDMPCHIIFGMDFMGRAIFWLVDNSMEFRIVAGLSSAAMFTIVGQRTILGGPHRLAWAA